MVDEHCDRLYPERLPGVLRVSTADGRTRELRVEASRGSPERPLSDEELETKLTLAAERALGTDPARRLAAALRDPAATTPAELLALAVAQQDPERSASSS